MSGYKLSILFCILFASAYVRGQCIFAPDEVCVNQCGPVFYLIADPPGTEYEWSISCGTITNETQANPHVACFMSPGICTVQVIVRMPLEEPDTCFVLVNVLPSTEGFFEETICPGDSITINGTYFQEGNWIDTLYGEAANGCDSILFITLHTFDPVIVYESYTGCEGDGYSVIVNDSLYDEANPTGTQLLETINGCDSLIIIDLQYFPATSDTFYYEGCEGDGFEVLINNNTYDESNPTGTEILTGSNGCDSVLTIHCIFYPVTYGYESYTGCEGDGYSVVVDSVVYDESNPTGVDTLTNHNGCDSIVTIMLTYRPPGQDTISYVGCMGDGYSIEVLGHVFDETNPSGTFVIIPPSGCDSIITIDLRFLDCPSTLVLEGDQLCVSDTADHYQWYTCEGGLLSDTTQCITVADTGCVCVIVTDGLDIDTICTTYSVCILEAVLHAPDTVCGLDSVLLYYVSDDTTITGMSWDIVIDTHTTIHFEAVDAVWVTFPAAGCYEVRLQLTYGDCLTTFMDSVCVYAVPESFFCCTQAICDSCVTLNVFLSGTPPWTVAISNGMDTDTITGIETSNFDYVDCPPFLPIQYTLVAMQDATCAGVIYDSSVFVVEQLLIDPVIDFLDDTLCTDFVGGFQYAWRRCEDQLLLSSDVCFVPSASGCYCVELTDVTNGCTYSACDIFMLTSTEPLPRADDVVVWYNKEEHSIDVVMEGLERNELKVLLTDLKGSALAFSGIETMGEDRGRIQLIGHMPPMLFVTFYTDQSRTTKGIFIPGE